MVILYIGIALVVGFVAGLRIGYSLGMYPLQIPKKSKEKKYYPGCCGMNKDHNDD